MEGTTYWGNLQFKVHDETPVTVQDGQTVLKPDENGIYTIPADMDDNVYHNIYIRDSCGNTIFYLKNKVRWNTLAHVDTLDEQKLPHGAVLSESLPATVTVRTAASGNQSVSVPVKWDEAADYVPAAKREQHFTVTGTLDLSGTDIVVLPEQESLQTVTVEVTVAGAPQYRVTATSSENGTVTVTNFAKTAEDGTPLFCKDELVMLSIAPDEGYMLSALSVNGIPATVAVGDDTYTFAQPEENVTITATFEKRNEHTVTFDAGDGTPSVGSMTTTNRKLSSLPSASRSKHSFDGWYTEKSGGTKVTTDTVFHANTTVCAHWTYTGGGYYYPPVTYYTLRFETGGGSDISSVQGTYNAYIDLTQYVPTWRGHTFTGWYSERSLTNKVSGVYLTKDMTVYAGWRVTTAPQTDDSSVLGLWGISLCTSLAGCLALTTWQIRRRREEQSLQSIEK